MRIALGSDEKSLLTEALVRDLAERAHEVIPFGALVAEGDAADWPLMASDVARAVASGRADQGIVCCWTGTGASIAANKVRGVRAALCHDAETAKGARVWNHANVLALSLRATSIPLAKEILAAWFSTPLSEDDWNLRQIARVGDIERA